MLKFLFYVKLILQFCLNKSALSIPSFQIEQSEKIALTANGGLFLLAELIEQMNLIESFARLGLYNRKTIGEAVHILALVINQFAGGDAIADTQYLDRDGAVRTIFGDMHIPAAQTSGAFLQRFTEETAEKRRQIIWQMQEKYLKKLSKRFNRKIIVSMDSTLYEVYGDCKEKSSKSYKGIFGYHPLLIHLHNTGELLDVVLRSGRDFTSGDAAAILETNLRRLKPYFDEIILLADSGFYEKAIVDVCEHDDLKIKFIITCELNAPIKQRVTDPQLAWRAPQAEPEENRANIEHRDSHSFNYRIQNLNYYSDSRLIAAGGDPNGTLDFYSVHYYGGIVPSNPTSISPFHHPKSYWGLDKSLVVAEFALQNTSGIAKNTLYEILYQTGYAGALAWSWTDVNLSSPTDMLAAMQSMWDNHREDVDVDGIGGEWPVVSITSPKNDTVFADGAAVLIQAEASDNDGSVVLVEFFANETTKIGERNSAPYSIIWTNITPGDYRLTAIVTDNQGHQRTSNTVRIKVGTPAMARLEAERATRQGQNITVRSNATASGGAYVEMRTQSGTITWQLPGVPAAGSYEIVFGYRLSFVKVVFPFSYDYDGRNFRGLPIKVIAFVKKTLKLFLRNRSCEPGCCSSFLFYAICYRATNPTPPSLRISL